MSGERVPAARASAAPPLSPESLDRLERWSDAGRAMLGELLERGASPLRKALLERALLAGHGPAEIDAFARAVKSLSDRELFEYCSVAHSGRWRRTPPGFATMLRAEADPLLAFELNGGYLRVDRRADERWLVSARAAAESSGVAFEAQAEPQGAAVPARGEPARALGADDGSFDARSGDRPSNSGRTAGLAGPPTGLSPRPTGVGRVALSGPSGPVPFDSGDVLPEVIARDRSSAASRGSAPSEGGTPRGGAVFDQLPPEDGETPTPLLRDAVSRATTGWSLRWSEFELDVRGGLPLEEGLERASRASVAGYPVPAAIGPAVGQSRRVVLLVQQHRSGQTRAWELYDVLSAELAWANEGDLLARRELPFADKRNRRLTRLALPRLG